jgi:acetyltransferase-like isoleucine patch superfamily enzyme
MKILIKQILGFIRCLTKGIKYQKRVYIGRHVHIINGKNLKIGTEVQIRPDVDIFVTDTIIIGDRSDVGTRNRISGNVIIEKDVLIGPDNYIGSYDHIYFNPNIPIIDQGAYKIKRNGHTELVIGRGSWISTHCAIIGDVHIGRNCVIGANSVVVKDIPDFSVAVGNPAKIIKRYDPLTSTWNAVSK